MEDKLDKLTIRTQQGANSTTWTRPPFYGDMTLPELFAFHAEKSPEHPVIVYDDEQGVVQTLHYKEVYPAIRRAADFVSEHLRSQSPSGAPNGIREQPVVGILAILDNITFTTLLTGIMYLGYTPFPISVRNSAVAVAHLIRRTSVRDLLVSHDAAMQRVAQEAKEELAKEGYEVNLLPVPTFDGLYKSTDGNATDIAMGPVAADKPAIILHSSGSTSFPKPVTLTHRSLTRWGFLTYFGDIDVCGLRCSMHCLPMFHIMGAIGIPWAVCTGVVVGQFRPSSPPVIPTPETVLRAIVATECNIALCVPSMIEAWARDSTNIPALRKLKALMYAGAPLNKEVGEHLLDEGVRLVTGYGMTEIGALGKVVCDQTKIPRSDWEYFSLSQPVEFIRVYQPGLLRVFEPVVVDCPTWSPNAFNTEVDGRPAYATSDLFEEHPTNPNLYRVYGRADDQIMLSTGEKTNPVPMEAILLQHPDIHAAIIFGRGRLQNGVIIQPKEPFDPADEAKLERFRNEIWPTVERANNFAPSHSRIFKEMITVTKPNKPFQYTAKGTPRRHVSLAEYAEEIEELYRKVEESSQVDVQLPPSWTDGAVREYVRGVVTKVLRAPDIGDEDDLFQQGCDSLQATWIRNTILHAVRATTSISTHDVPLNFVYANPTIASLSAFLRGLISGQVVDQDAERAARLSQMQELVRKYGTKWPTPEWASTRDRDSNAPAGNSETVLITGTTGRLGSHLLAQLLKKPEVARVYVLNREPTGDPAKLGERQRDAFKTWHLDEDLLSSTRVSFHPADLTEGRFGLEERTFVEMRDSVSAVIHNAWRVDFNVTLPSFEPLIAGTRNLLNFALSSPIVGGPKFLFVSSIASVRNHPSDTPVQETLDLGPEFAVGQGYGESKWVAEQILALAGEATGLKTSVVRVGQLSGDTLFGGWNTTEWVPAMVRVGKRLGCIPSAEETVSWVPVDVAASALLEMLYAGERVMHLTSTSPVPWDTVFGALAEELEVRLVQAFDWLARLRQSAQYAGSGTSPEDASEHEAAHNLLPFFEAAMSAKQVEFDTEIAVRVSPSLARLDPLGKEDVKKWVRFWRDVGFFAV
ncbi:acetyl-CoA synthetase-like protein [Trametes cingulata]|nr:acetyl-CoA synthetase-like protein [Trametes cingulata]